MPPDLHIAFTPGKMVVPGLINVEIKGKSLLLHMCKRMENSAGSLNKYFNPYRDGYKCGLFL
jgi:hypothetical protein